MSPFEDDLPALFRSLRPDKSDLLKDATLSAKEAEQKWPLLRNVSPKNHDLPPALTDEERQNWNTSGGMPKVTAPKQALSLPGMGEKIAKSLERMSARTANVATPVEAVPAESRPPEVAPLAATVRKPSPKKRPQLTAPSPPIEPAHFPFTTHSAPTGDLACAPDTLAATPSEKPKQSNPARAEDSLAQVFSRLEGKSKPTKKPPAKPASFLGRLGRR